LETVYIYYYTHNYSVVMLQEMAARKANIHAFRKLNAYIISLYNLAIMLQLR
jgi:hypothetical protein